MADLGVVWPIIALRSAERLGVELDFLSYPQESAQGKAMRAWIVENVAILDRPQMLDRLKQAGGQGING